MNVPVNSVNAVNVVKLGLSYKRANNEALPVAGDHYEEEC